jgi:hypothetical protein
VPVNKWENKIKNLKGIGNRIEDITIRGISIFIFTQNSLAN